MARYAYDRLSAQDLSFLLAESDASPMHVGAVAVLESGGLRTEAGGIDIAAYRRAVEAVLHWIPRYRQKLAWIPIDSWPVWIDDRHFDLGYHVRHLSLPRPGTLDQLKELASRILARPLDRARPLWEIWVIEGLQNGEQFALLNKVHHCMIDGAAGADLSQILFSPTATTEIAEPVPYLPRPEPGSRELLGDALRLRAQQPLQALRAAGEWLGSPGKALPDELNRRAGALAELASWALRPASQTPINGDLSPYRRFDWLTMPLSDVRELRRVLGCTVNDIVLATVAGALRRYFFRHRVDPAGLDFRVSAPVSVRRDEHARGRGNHVSAWIVPLPLGELDPLKQLAAIGERTEELKHSQAALGVETLMAVAEWLPAGLISRGVGMAQGPINMIVTNVPGPQFPLFSVGARLLGMYPAVPLISGGGLGVAIFSYEGKLCWGFNGDSELVPDLSAFVADLAAAFEELRNATVTRFMASRTAPPEVDVAVQTKRRKRSPVAVNVAGQAPSDAGRAPALDEPHAPARDRQRGTAVR
jgi:WS/DGAT/MGAT family acyltransferase